MANSVRIGAQVTGVKKASSDLDNLRDKFAKLQSQGAKGFAIGAGAAITAGALNMAGDAAAKAVQFIGDAVSAASDLQESTSKATVVFGDAIGTVEKFAETSATAFGISKRAAMEAAGTFGNLFLSTGLAKDAAAEMSVKVVSLAADLASFNNVPIEDALLAIRSGLVGEAEPMRKFGVLLNEATVKAKGLEMGLADAKGVMTDAAKVQARYAIILGQTGTAQGDFERTSDGLANSNKALQATIADVTAEIGEKLLPMMKELSVFARDNLVPALEATGKALDFLRLVTNPSGAAAQFMADRTREEAAALLSARDATIATIKALREHMLAEEGVSRAMHSVMGTSEDAKGAMDRLTGGVAKSVAATETAKGAMEGFAGGLAKAAESTKTSVEVISSSLDDMADAFDETWSELSGAADQAAEDIFGPLERRAELAANKLAQGAALGVIADPTSSKADIAGARTELLGLQRDFFTLTAEMAGRGELTAKELGKLTAALKAELKTATEEESLSIRALLTLLDQLRAKSKGLFVINTSGNFGARAEGGPVTANAPVIVGERGPELFVPGANGAIVPNAGRGGRTWDGGSDASARWLPIIAAQLSRLTAQEPYAARPMTARGDLARQAAMMPGGRL